MESGSFVDCCATERSMIEPTMNSEIAQKAIPTLTPIAVPIETQKYATGGIMQAEIITPIATPIIHVNHWIFSKILIL